MCGRMSLFDPQPEIERRFSAEFSEDWTPRYNIAPRQDLAVIPNEDPAAIEQYEWGLAPHWMDDPEDGPRPINARAESVAEKPYFREPFKSKRCLVLADGFYEWQGQHGSKQPYRIERADDEPFAFAGLWDSWSTNGDQLDTVTIITTEPNAVMEPIHDRMPVMLEPGDEGRWLQADDPDELQALLDPYLDELLDAYTISKRVNDPGNASPDVIEPVDIGEQSGLGEFR